VLPYSRNYGSTGLRERGPGGRDRHDFGLLTCDGAKGNVVLDHAGGERIHTDPGGRGAPGGDGEDRVGSAAAAIPRAAGGAARLPRRGAWDRRIAIFVRVSERREPGPVACWIAQCAAAPQYRHYVSVAPDEGGWWRVHLDQLLDVCEAYDATGLTYWQAAEEVHEILAALDVRGEWTIATWWSGGTS
jgi:hypothetical protein